MTRQELRELIRTYVQEVTFPLSDTIANDLLTQAEESLSDIAEYSAARFSQDFVTDDFDYELDKSMLSILSVAWEDADGDATPVPGPTSIQQMDDEFPSWRTDTADRPVRWFILGNAIVVHPKPSATYNATPMEVWATVIPPAMANDAAEPEDLPLRFHRTLAKYAAWKWLSIDKENPSARALAQFWQAEYQADAVRLRMLIGSRSQADQEDPRVRVHRPSALGIGTLPDDEDE